MAAPSQTAVFTRLVRDHMRPAPAAVPAGTACAEAIAAMVRARASALAVTDETGRLLGLVTEQDVTRRIAYRLDPGAPIDRAMSSPVTTVRDGDGLYQAIGLMRRRGLRHIPVVDGGGRAVGMFELHDALGTAATQMIDHIDRLTHESSVAGLAEVKSAQVAVAEGLLADNLPAPEVLTFVSEINDDLYRRAVTLCLNRLAEAGEGAPPVSFAVIVMGSGGRGESAFMADQDNGFVIADYPDPDHDVIDDFFRDLAERMTEMLDHIGLPLCRGGVMATNPLWRKTLGQWRTQLDGWLRRADPAMVRLGDIFFDFRPVYGDHRLAQALRDHVTATAAHAPTFLNAMHEIQADHGTALGPFRRLIWERRGPHKGELNLKYRASLPLVENVRLLALRNAVAETHTGARIAALAEAGVLESGERDQLSDAFSHIAGLCLRRQIADFKAGRRPDYWLRQTDLSARDRRRLVDSLKAIETLRGLVAREFSAVAF